MNEHLKTNALTSLCFNRDDFTANEFCVDKFVSECRRYASLETMQEDLSMFQKLLNSAMILLINQDYSDFVNLSSNLVGLDKAIKSLSLPLQTLQTDVNRIKTSLIEILTSTQGMFSERASIHSSKVLAHHVLNVLEGLEKITALNQALENNESSEQLKMLEQIAFAYNTVQFHVNKISFLRNGSPKEETVKHCAKDLKERLDTFFLQSLIPSASHKKDLRKVLRIYSIISAEDEVENCFRQAVVSPFMKNVITQVNISKYGLTEIYNKILAFIENSCTDIMAVTRGTFSDKGQTEVVTGYDFLVNSVWPEVMDCMEFIDPVYLYSVGDPHLFHQNYTASMTFLEKFEHCCGVQSSVKRLRAGAPYKNFFQKWNLNLYFHIRFQEIAGQFESDLAGDLIISTDENPDFKLTASCSLWSSLNLCWRDHIFLFPLRNSFWRLTLQLLSRYREWACLILQKQKDNGAVQIALLISDVELLVPKVKSFSIECVYPKLNNQLTNNCINDAFSETLKMLEEIPSLAGKKIIEILTQKCTTHLKHISNIPQRFRKTNREIPSKPSAYVSQVLDPLIEFLQDTQFLQSEWRQHYRLEITDGILKECIYLMKDVLTSIKKMEESLKILKRAKPTEKVSDGAVTDDDKIRRQLAIDVNYFEELIHNSGWKTTEIKSLKKLKDLVSSAERSSNVSSNS